MEERFEDLKKDRERDQQKHKETYERVNELYI